MVLKNKVSIDLRVLVKLKTLEEVRPFVSFWLREC